MHSERLLDRSHFADAASSYHHHPSLAAAGAAAAADTNIKNATLWDRLLQPSILVPLGILLLSVLYQYLVLLHSSSPAAASASSSAGGGGSGGGPSSLADACARHRNNKHKHKHKHRPGALLWDLLVTLIPGSLLYQLDRWLHPSPLSPVPGSDHMSHSLQDLMPPSLSNTAPPAGVSLPGDMMTLMDSDSVSLEDQWSSLSPADPWSHEAKSDALGRLLGMDNSQGMGMGFVGAVAHAGRRGFSSFSIMGLVRSGARRAKPRGDRSKSSPTVDRPPGLGNRNNSCFQNSILQGLSSLSSLPVYLTSALEAIRAGAGDDGYSQSRNKYNKRGRARFGGSSGESSSTVATLRDLLSQLTSAENNGATLWTPEKLKSLDTWQQQDAQEYYSKILDEVDKEVTRAAAAVHRRASPGLEAAGLVSSTTMRDDDTATSQHSDDSGYQSLPTTTTTTLGGKPIFSSSSSSSSSSSEVKTTAMTVTLRNPLEGLIAQRVACTKCGYSEGLSMMQFNCITLSLGVGRGARNLREHLDAYTALEPIEGVECAKCTLLEVQQLGTIVLARHRDNRNSCTTEDELARFRAVDEALETEDFDEATLREKCKIERQHRVSSTKTKQMVIGRPPASLVVHINRSVFDEKTGHLSKDPTAVLFPSRLDLGPWCLGSAGSADTRARAAVEQWSSDPESSMVSGDLRPSKVSGPIYELRAVVTHRGQHENGHYVCYRKHPRRTVTSKDESDDEKAVPCVDLRDDDSKWWHLSDDDILEVDEKTVLSCGDVFMLFYDCVDPNSVLASGDLDQDRMSADDDKSVGVSEPHGADDARRDTETHEADHATKPDVTHAARSESGALERPEAIPHAPCLEQSTALRTEELPADRAADCAADCPAHRTSILQPPLRRDEDIDPMIPLTWPEY
ncbi:cysteine proteinase [Xylaria scruposa]|nr:cysteine proteinase [Xylaria scruposa]